MLFSFLVVYTPFLCLVRSWRSLRVVFTRWVQLGFSWCSVSFGVGSFLGCFWFLPLRVTFTLLLLHLVFFGLRFPSRRGLPLGRVPDSFRYFSFFMFLRFHPLPLSLVGLVPLFMLPAVVSFLLRSFRAVSIFSFFSALPRVLCPLFSSGSSLGLFVSCFGFWPMCLTLRFANFVLPCGYIPGCFFGCFSPLPVHVSEFSPMAWSPSVVRFCFLPLFLRPFPAVVAVVFPFGLFGALSLSLSSSFHVSVLGAFDPSLRLISFYVVCALPLFLLVLLFFPLVCVLFSCLLGLRLVLFLLLPSFSSFGVSFRIVFFFVGFFSVSSLLFLCFFGFLVLVPRLVFLGFRVSFLLELFL